MGQGAVHTPGASPPAQGSCRHRVPRAGASLGTMLIFLSQPRCWGRWGGVCYVGQQRACIPQRSGAGEEARGCSWTRPPGRNVLGDPRVARRHPDRPRGQQAVGIRGAPYPGDPPLSSLSGSCLRPLLSQGLRQLPRHRPLDVCTFLLVNVSRNQKLRDAALRPRRPFCSPQLEISIHAGWAHTHTHTHPSSCLAAPQHPDSTGKLRKLPELPGQMAGTSPGRAQGNRAPCGSGAMPPPAARLARCPPARCQAKFLAISRLTPAARDAPASSCCLPPAPHTGREHPHVPMLHGPIYNPCVFGTYPHGDPIGPFSEITCLPPHAVPACSSTHG